ncbi:MAG TPA: helix-turn-helix transcriptional regulator [Streptosporangiaceae bacterium]|jgi:transcriptional regulator with XRE-family HTH domain
MAISPSSSVQRARQQVATRLREIRLDAGLTAHELSAAADWHKSKTSRIENARQALTDEDIRVWCRICEAEGQAADLIAASRAADSMYLEWRRLHVAGMRRTQETRIPLYERTRIMRIYCSTVIPGLCQTPSYAAALMSAITRFQGTPDDVAEAVEARMRRNRVLSKLGRKFVMVIEESVLRYGVGDAAVMTEQLDRLLKVIELPSVWFGIIPFTVERRPMWTLEAFTCFDAERIRVELLAAQVTVTVPREVRLYLNAFDELAALAVSGDQARDLIHAAMGPVA